MSNKNKINLIRSLKPGDIVITGNHIGAVRYLGPLEGLDHKNQNPNDRTRIYNLYVGIELTEPNGHMDGSMHINGKKITYFTTKYGNNLKKGRKKRPMNTSENESKYDNDVDDSDDAKYGILIPAISIQKKIDSFTLLKKITMVFEQYKIIKKRLNYYKNQHKTDQQSNQNEQSLIDIKTNSDLISPPTTSGYGIRSNIPISQPSIISNNVSTTTAPGFSSNSNNNNSHKYKKFSTAPVFNNGLNNAYDNEINNNNENTHTQNNDKLSLRKINSAPYLHHSEMNFTDSNNTNNGQINNNNNAINNGYLMHRHSHTMHGQSYEPNTNQRLFAPQSNVTTPHIDDEINNSSFPSISEEQPTFESHSKSYTNPTMARLEHKRQLNSSLPAPHHYTLNRGQSYNKKYNKSHSTNNTQSRARGNSFQSYNSYVSHMATKRTPEPPNNIKSNSANASRNNSLINNKLSISSTTNKLSQSPLSCPVSPAISHETMVINNEDKQNEDSISNDIIHSINSTPKMESETCKKQNEIMVKIEEISELPKIPNTILSPEHSQQSDQTMNTQRSRVISVSGHHPSASMYTHAPLNHWNDSNGKNKLTSVGGSADKNKDLSSLAIKISSPRHTRPKSAMDFNQRESVNVNNKINHFANQDSIQLKNLLEDLKKNKLNQINIISEIDNNNNKNTMDILTDDSSESNTSNNNNINNDDLPKLMDNVTTAATVHSPTADVLENMVTHSIASPEEKLAQVENNEDEKQLLPTDAMSDIATPIPKEVGNTNIIDVEVDEFDIFDVDSNINSNSPPNPNNIPKRLSLTESSLRKHNKRRSSRDSIISDNEIKKIKNYVFTARKMNIHHHVQTLSEPMLPKFALMMNDFDSSEDEKSASSDGEDTQSLGMENNLDDSIHTHDVTEDDIQYMNQNNNNNILTPVNTNITKPKNKSNDNKLFSPTFTADSISRRSSINLTSGVWDYITPKNKEIDINNVSNITLYNLSNDGDANSIGYQTPKQQYIKRMVGHGNTSSTPTYSSYKTRHEYLRDMTYFTTLHRAQQFKKLQKEKIEGIIENKNEEKSMSPPEKDNKHLKSNSITSLDIIQEKIFDDENNNKKKNKNKNNNNNNETNIKEEEINIGHRTQLSCDTRAAIEGGIEPYKPTQHTLHQSAMV